MKKYNTFQFKILWFRLVSVSAESYGQILSFGFGIGPKPKRWFRSYTTPQNYKPPGLWRKKSQIKVSFSIELMCIYPFCNCASYGISFFNSPPSFSWLRVTSSKQQKSFALRGYLHNSFFKFYFELQRF